MTGVLRGLQPAEIGTVYAYEGHIDILQFNKQSHESLNPLVRANAQIAPDGAYTLTGLDPGAYTLLATATHSNGPDYADNARFVTTTITLTDNQTATQDFDLR